MFTRGDKPIRDFRKSWENLCTAAGVPALLFHDLRRTAARNLRAAGVPEEIIMRIAGWKTSSIFKRYAIVDKADVRAALQQLERARQKPFGSYRRAQFNRARIPTVFPATDSCRLAIPKLNTLPAPRVVGQMVPKPAGLSVVIPSSKTSTFQQHNSQGDTMLEILVVVLFLLALFAALIVLPILLVIKVAQVLFERPTQRSCQRRQ